MSRVDFLPRAGDSVAVFIPHTAAECRIIITRRHSRRLSSHFCVQKIPFPLVKFFIRGKMKNNEDSEYFLSVKDVREKKTLAENADSETKIIRRRRCRIIGSRRPTVVSRRAEFRMPGVRAVLHRGAGVCLGQ